MAILRINEFDHREFNVVVGKGPDGFKAIARDKGNAMIAEVSGETQEEVECEIKAKLNPLSSDFVTLEGGVNLFLRVFPRGFEDPFYRKYEGDYKREAQSYIGNLLNKKAFEGLLQDDQFGEICERVKRSFNKTNLVSPFEKMALKEVLERSDVQKHFAHSIYELVHGESFDTALQKVVALLESRRAAKWTIVTYLPFFLEPSKHVYVKPEILQNCAYRLGYELDYVPIPNPGSYRSCVGLYDMILEGISTHKARDFIDVQSFMYVIGKEGYVAEALKAREGPSAGGGAP